MTCRRMILTLAGAWFALAAPAAHATAVFDNLASSQDGSDPIFGVGPLAQSFTTGASPEALDDAVLLLTNGSTAYSGSLQVSLLANTATGPGSTLDSLGSLADSLISTAGTEEYTFTPAAPLVLAADTTYWVEAAQATPNAISWSYSYDMSALGVANQSADSAAYGLNPSSSYGAYQLQVDVPEPASLSVLVSGLLGLAWLRRQRRG